MEHPKFIINDGRLIIGTVEFHADLLRDNSKTIGGGWWYFDKDSNTMYLYGTSVDFGSVTEQQAREAWEYSLNYKEGINMIFSTSDKLSEAMKKEANYKIYLGDKLIGTTDDLKLDVDSSNGEKDEIGIVGHGKLGKLGNIAIVGLVDSFPLTEALTALETPNINSIDHFPYHRNHEKTTSLFGAERKKKKPCTYHEYEVGKDHTWRCRHCEHPLN